MITQQVIDYIKQQLQNGVNKAEIKTTLVGNGWNAKEIDEIFKGFAAQPNTASPEKNRRWPKILFAILLLIVIGGLILISLKRLKKNSPSPESVKTPLNNQFAFPEPPYSLIITGVIKEGQAEVNLDPFFFITSSGETPDEENPLAESQFKTVLKKSGQPIYEKKLDVLAAASPAEGTGPQPTQDYGSFSQYLGEFETLPDEISILYQDKEIFNLKEPENPPPQIFFTSQEYQAETLKIAWKTNTATELHYLAFVSNADTQTIPSNPEIALPLTEDNLNSDGSIIFADNSFAFLPRSFIEGDLQVTIYATDGFRTLVGLSKIFSLPKGLVTAKIISPENGQTYSQNTVLLEADSFDPRTGIRCGGCPKEGNTFIWSSDIDGIIFQGHDALCQYLTLGEHNITLRVKNENGTEASDQVKISITSGGIPEATAKEKQLKKKFCY
ncbi:MAG: hypothetical protein JW991_04180 [Candidatus Pacebacteria bacterium]|nr:hypothetical protein [Candidatus Paceibacterota bacterium]